MATIPEISSIIRILFSLRFYSENSFSSTKLYLGTLSQLKSFDQFASSIAIMSDQDLALQAMNAGDSPSQNYLKINNH